MKKFDLPQDKNPSGTAVLKNADNAVKEAA